MYLLHPVLISVGNAIEDSLRDEGLPRTADGRLSINAPNSTHIGARFDCLSSARRNSHLRPPTLYPPHWPHPMLIGVGGAVEDSPRDKGSSRAVDGRLWIDAPNPTHTGARFDYCSPGSY